MDSKELEAAAEIVQRHADHIPISGIAAPYFKLAAQALREKAAAGQGFEEWYQQEFLITSEHEREGVNFSVYQMRECWYAAKLAQAAKVRELEAERDRLAVELRKIWHTSNDIGPLDSSNAVRALVARYGK